MRRVAVQFVAELASFKRGMREGAEEVRKVKQEAADAQREVAGLGEVGEKAGRQFADGFVRGADGRLRDAKGRFLKAGQESGRGFGDGLVDGMGPAAGRAVFVFSKEFTARLGPLLIRVPWSFLGPVGTAIAAPIALSAASAVGAAIGGAVLGGAAGGGVIGGLALASRDSRVKSAAKDLGRLVMSDLEDSAVGFVDPALGGISEIRDAWRSVRGDVQAAFGDAARYVRPLARGIAGLVREVAPGIRTAIAAAEPVIAVFEDRLPKIGLAIKDALSTISGDAQGAAAGLDLMLEGLGGIIRVGGEVVGFFTDMFRVVVDVADAALSVEEMLLGWNPLMSERLEESRQRIDHLKGILNDTGTVGQESGTKIAGGLSLVATEAEKAAAKTQSLKDAFNELFGAQMSLDRATIAYKEGVKRLNEELTHGGRTLSENSVEGRKNRTAVLDQIAAINTLRESRIAEGMSVTEANAKYDAHLAALRRTMLQAGFTQAEVDTLIGAYRRIPSKAETRILADAGQALSAMQRVKQYKIPNKTFFINGVYRELRIAGRDSAGGVANRWGGVYQRAQVGVLREAQIASPVYPARYAWAEPATRGEAFIPRNGNRERSISIGRRAMEWYGMAVVPKAWITGQPQRGAGAATQMGAAGGGLVIQNLTVRGYSDRFSMAQVRQELAMYGVR